MQMNALLHEARTIYYQLVESGVTAGLVSMPGAVGPEFPAVSMPHPSLGGVGATPGAAFAQGAASASAAGPVLPHRPSMGIPPGFPSCSAADQSAGGAGGLGFPTGAAAGGDAMAMETMARMVAKMREDLQRRDSSDQSGKSKKDGKNKKDGKDDKGSKEKKSKKEKKEKEKKKKHKKKKKKKHGSRSRRRRRGDSSPGTSSSSTTSGTSSRSGSDSDDYLRWEADGRNKKVDPRKVQRFATKRFKDQGDVIAFASQHPGALTAHFLQMVHQRFCQVMMKDTREMRSHSLVDWTTHFSHLSDIRDQKEVMTLSLAMDSINARKLETAMDVLAQRISAVQAAKSKGGSWEKAAKIELTLPPGQASSSSGLLRLTM
jgi:hypothetical protein